MVDVSEVGGGVWWEMGKLMVVCGGWWCFDCVVDRGGLWSGLV